MNQNTINELNHRYKDSCSYRNEAEEYEAYLEERIAHLKKMNGTGGDEKMYRTTNSDRQKPCPVCAKRDERRAHLKEWATHAAKASVYATFQVGITLSVLFAVGSGLITLPW